MTTELGRQPWLIYGLFRTQDGYSDVVSSGDVLFTLIGMAGLYFVLGLLYPLIVDSLKDIAVIGDFVPRTDSMVTILMGTMMALGVGLKRHPAPAAIVAYSGALATTEALPKDAGSAPAA